VAAQRASMSLRGVLGVPDVTPDENKPEQSGTAIRARQAEQQQATSHFGDSTKGGVRHTGRIIVAMGREIYDAPRILRINGKDEKEIALLVSKGDPDPATRQRLGLSPDQQIEHMLNPGVGEYDITVTGGKLKDTQRQETADVIQAIMPMLPPPLAVKAAAELVRQTDGLGDLAETLAPADDSGMVPVEQLEQLKQEATQVIDEAKAKIDELQKVIDGKLIEAETKRAIATEDTAAKVEIETRKLQSAERVEGMKLEAEIAKAHIAKEQAENVARLTPAPQPSASPEFGG
jgi:hypothetical protein